MPTSKGQRLLTVVLSLCFHATDEGGNNVILKKMALVVDGRPDIELNLTGTLVSTSFICAGKPFFFCFYVHVCLLMPILSVNVLSGDLAKLKETPIVIKEGVSYKIKIEFRVQREIVAGLRYFQTFYRKSLRGIP